MTITNYIMGYKQMAKAKVVHSDDGVTTIFRGNKKNPEPSLGVIKFPGGYVEVSRTSDGEYWCHTFIDESAKITDSRIDYNGGQTIPSIPDEQNVQKIAVKIKGSFIEFN